MQMSNENQIRGKPLAEAIELIADWKFSSERSIKQNRAGYQEIFNKEIEEKLWLRNVYHSSLSA